MSIYKKFSYLTFSFFIGIGILTPSNQAWATSAYTSSMVKTITNGGRVVTQGDGFLYVATGTTVRQIRLSDGTLNSFTYVFTGSTSPITQLAATNDQHLFALHEDGLLDVILVGVSGPNIDQQHPATVMTCSGSNSATLNSLTAYQDEVFLSCAPDNTLYEVYFGGEIRHKTMSGWTPSRSTLKGNSIYALNISSGATDVRRLSASAFYGGDTLTAVTAIVGGNYGNATQAQLTSDNNYVWSLSGTDGNVYRLTRIAGDNTITTYNFTGYLAGSTGSNYQAAGMSSDGSNLWISLSQSSSGVVLKFDIASGTFESIVTTTEKIGGIYAITNGFWLSSSTAATKYLTVPATSTDTSAEARRKRQAAIDAARLALVSKIKAGNVILNPDLTDADLPVFNPDLAKRANAEFAVAAKAKDFGFNAVRTIVTKYSIYQDIENGVRSNVSGRLAFAAGIVPASVRQKQTLINQVMNALPADRSTVEDIDKLIAELAKAQEDRQARKDAIINKIATRK